MTPDEKSLHSLPLYLIGDDVEIAATGIIGEVVGFKIEAGSEDQYLVFYVDNAGNPQERYWRASDLEGADYHGGPESNVIPFPCACERQVRKQTRH